MSSLTTLARALIRALTVGVPALSPRGLARFRLALGIAIVWFIWRDPFRAVSVSASGESGFNLTAAAPVRWLAENEALVNEIRLVAMVAALVFAIGLLPRLTFAITIAGCLAWVWAVTATSGAHPYSVLILPLLALLTVRWDAAPPLYHRTDDHGPAERRLGFAPWVMCLMLGLAFAAAAWSKVRDGSEWVSRGNAKFAWVTDAREAKVTWGLWLAAQPRLSVALSAAVVAIESVVVVAAFTRSRWLRLGLGAAALGLLLGFDLLQGVFWPAWWIALLGFVPWDGLWTADRPARGDHAGSPVTAGQAIWVVFLVAQQVVVSATSTEIHPIASRYDMYSTLHTTDDSVGDRLVRRLRAVGPDGTHVDITDCAGDSRDLDKLRACAGGTADAFEVVEDHEVFDWSAGRFTWEYQDKVIERFGAR